ncbi:MAG TPA: MarC family protein [Deltaproteobacteria bacterium]|nr:MAG: hypothetical protein A2048_08950 [Deltaproteobacteria bacterium GWA2_45_12]HBF12108.1 MarC family protein [Deltaproteobacteria bacterium]
MESFLLCFIPLFVALDPPGVMPMFLGLTQGLSPQERSRVLRHSMVTAFVVSILFLFGGQAVFKVLGISLADFQIAGGLILVVFAIRDLLQTGREVLVLDSTVGVVPIGIPLIVGPAALTTLLMLSREFSVTIVLLSLVTNLVLNFVLFNRAPWIEKIIGIAGMRAFSKIVALFLAAIAVMFVRMGVTAYLTGV